MASSSSSIALVNVLSVLASVSMENVASVSFRGGGRGLPPPLEISPICAYRMCIINIKYRYRDIISVFNSYAVILLFFLLHTPTISSISLSDKESDDSITILIKLDKLSSPIQFLNLVLIIFT